MFVILREKPGSVPDDDLMDIFELAGFVDSDTADLVAIRKVFGDGLLISEQITVDFDTMKSAIPGELDRAITAWNEMTDRVNIHIDKVKNRARLVPPYRKWKKAIGRRDYLLEQLIPDVEAQPFLWPTITFGSLFRVKDGEFRSDKIHARGYAGASNGQATEKDYLGLARRIGIWQRDHDHLYTPGDGGDGDRSYESAFERGTGISWPKWEALRKQFNGQGAGA